MAELARENNEASQGNEEDERKLQELTELADNMFNEGVWQNSKEQMKEMSKRESSLHMFRMGFFMHSKYIDMQMKALTKEFDGKSKEEIDKIINNLMEKDKND